MRYHDSLHISWFGGEPLLNLEAIDNISNEAINICNLLKKKYTASITTNGYLLTENIVEKLIKNRVFSYTVTIDGLKEYHDGLRVLKNGTGTFDKIISNLLNMKKINDKRLDIKIRINFTKDSLLRGKEFCRYLNDTFGDDRRFKLLFRFAGDWGGERVNSIKSQLLNNDYNTLLKMLENENNNLVERSFNVDLANTGLQCSANYLNKYSIGIDGTIAKCDTVNENTKIGFLNEYGEMKINRAIECDWMYNDILQNETCDNCYYSSICFKTSCPKLLAFYGEISCPLTNNEVDAFLKLYAKKKKIDII